MPRPAKTARTSTPERAAFVIGDHTVAAGSTLRIELPVARSISGALFSLPLAIVHGTRPGPTIWISAAIHGDELNGIPIVRRVLKRVADAGISGTLIAAPAVNVFGLSTGSRYLPDRRDLNRSFPGSKRGSLAAQLAHLFVEDIVNRSDYGIDLHTGAVGRANLPQVRCDLDEPRTADLAQAFGAPVTLHSALRDGSLRACARARDIPTLLYEAGEAGRFDDDAIEVGVHGILRIMGSLDMIEAEELAAPSIMSRSSSWIRARSSGFCQLRTKLGCTVDEGQEIATMFDALGHREQTVRTSASGIVVGLATQATLHRGDALAHIAELS